MNRFRDVLSSPGVVEIKRKRRGRRMRTLLISVLLIASIIAGLSFLSHFDKISITKITVNGTEVISPDAVRARIESKLAGSYLGLFSRHNSLIYPKQRIHKDLVKAFPRIEALTIQGDGLSTLTVDIKERAGSYLWCGAVVPAQAVDRGENCYFLNSDGYIFDKAPYFSGNIYLTFYIPLPNPESDPKGQSLGTPSEFHTLIRFFDTITASGLTPAYVVFTDTNRELYLAHKEGETTPKIMWKAENDLDLIGENLASAMAKSEFRNEIRSGYAKLWYIDLRFDNRVLYKFQ